AVPGRDAGTARVCRGLTRGVVRVRRRPRRPRRGEPVRSALSRAGELHRFAGPPVHAFARARLPAATSFEENALIRISFRIVLALSLWTATAAARTEPNVSGRVVRSLEGASNRLGTP